MVVSPMKVAYVIPYLQKPSGWRTHTCGLIQAIRQYVEPVLVVSQEDYLQAGTLFPGLPIVAVPVTQQVSLQSASGWRKLAACYTAIRRTNLGEIDLVHSLEAYPTGLVGSWLAERINCPHVITTHGTYGVAWHAYRLDRRVYAGVLRKTSLVCPVSHGTARLMQQYFGDALTGVPITPILNGNDFYKAVPAEVVNRRALTGKPVVLSVGDIKPRKGQHVSLAAFAKVKARIPEAEYRLVGHYEQDNAYYRQLKSLIADQQLEDVTFLGAISNGELRRQYQQAAVFILTPQEEGLNFEGFGLVYLEAGAYGLPVVATNTGGVPDAVRNGETGFLLERDDVAGITQAVNTLLLDPELNIRMGQANRRWAETLTWERTAQEQFGAYQEVLASNRQAPI
jgi:phosphatidylinositol alpha-1,6-mannosyltransferase